MSTRDLQNIASTPMQDAYHPEQVESSWDQWWESQDLYKPTEDTSNGSFVIVLPPPNVTGSLHLGHALTVAIQDSVVRYNRMMGKSTLWVPGLDHAGIATQVIVEKQLKKTTGQSRHDIGRDAFVAKVWEWKDEYGGKILNQLRSLGTSLDWTRLRFTLDEMCGKAVLEAFLRMHENKIIYRDNRLVSWSCALKSAISTIEVDYIEVTGSHLINIPNYDQQVEIGVMHSFAYRLVDGEPDEELIVATTRIETMLGDVAVAVNPKDERYTKYHGRYLQHPFIPERRVVVITDETLVDMNFGTGAVKITPAHDPNDYQCGVRHNLEVINILDDEGKMNSNAGANYVGKHRFAVREQIVQDLTALGLYRGKVDNPMSVGVCSRTGDIVEPLIKPQWWVSCQNMASRALEAAQKGDLHITPEQHNLHWEHWLANIQDWCVSRQLWWGHRIPAYYVLEAGQTWPVESEKQDRWVIAASSEDALQQAVKRFPEEALTLDRLHQDEDVLDTWFSSGLFPFSVLGWPDESPENTDFHRFFPGDLLETGGDILFFWVARMVMMSQELTGKLPFHTVYLHPLVRDRLGRKMSKSLGNVIDPLDVITGCSLEQLLDRLNAGNLSKNEISIASDNQTREFPKGIEQCGADALRFGLLSYTKQSGDINLDINIIVSARHFCNKMWQAMRFALKNFGDDFVVPYAGFADVQQHMAANPAGMLFEQEWILTKLHKLIINVHEAYSNYQFGLTTQQLQSFFVDDLCSRYLEIIKQRVRQPTAEFPNPSYDPVVAQSLLSVLFYSLDTFLRLLHPICPFVTEELWHRLPGHQQRSVAPFATTIREQTGSIMIQRFPRVDDISPPFAANSQDQTACEDKMTLLLNIIEKIRAVKARLEIPNHVKPPCFLECQDDNDIALFTSASHLVAILAFVARPQVVHASSKSIAPGTTVRNLINSQVTLHMELNGNTFDFSNELVKNERRVIDLEVLRQRLELTIEKTNNNPKVKQDVKERNAQQLTETVAEFELLTENIKYYKTIVQDDKYKTAKTKDLENVCSTVEKAKDKLQGTIAKSKNGPSDRQTAELASLDEQIAQLQQQIAQLQL